MRLRYINNSTSLPVDDALERHLHRVMGASTADRLLAVDREERLNRRMMRFDHGWDCDVLFVSAPELDRERGRAREEWRTEDDEVDPLGLYFSCHSDFGRPLIKVSPEKIMQAGADLRRKHGVALALDELYPLLLSGVVIHELAHWLMDDRQDRRDDRRRHWLEAVHDVEESDRNGSKWEREWRQQREREWQNVLSRSYPGCEPEGYAPGPAEARHHRVVEESLCNALKLVQRLMPEERAVLEAFVRHAPPAYRAGLAWQMPERKVLQAMLAWHRHKATLRRLRRDWGNLLPVIGAPADCLSQTLLAGTAVTAPPDFERDLALFVAAQLPTMVQAWGLDSERHDAALNGGSGVYNWLCSEVAWRERGLTEAQRDSWLIEWATRGPTGAKHAAEFRR